MIPAAFDFMGRLRRGQPRDGNAFRKRDRSTEYNVPSASPRTTVFMRNLVIDAVALSHTVIPSETEGSCVRDI